MKSRRDSGGASRSGPVGLRTVRVAKAWQIGLTRASLMRIGPWFMLAPVAVRQLFEEKEFKWEAPAGPAVDRGPIPRHVAIDPAPSLVHVRHDDLRSVPPLPCLHNLAVAQGGLVDSEAGFLGFVATAFYCLRVGDRPAALFAHLVRSGDYPAALEDEDRAPAALCRTRAAGSPDRRWLVPSRPTS